MPNLLFSREYDYLGEVVFRDGCFDACTLSRQGEAMIGAQCNAWQTSGIPWKERHEGVVAMRSVLLTSHEAEVAFRCWADSEGYLVLHLPERLLPHWHKLCQMVLEPEERFVSIRAMLNASHAELQAWDRAMDATIAKNN